MITILTGQPGNGKTSKIIQIIREANAQGRIVYTVGIPKLLLPTIQVSREKIKTWSERTEIPVQEKEAYRITGKFDPLADFNRYATEPANDGEPTYLLDNFVEGSLIIVDEAHKSFPPTSSNRVPEYIDYLSEHRHHGLDFLFISQHPNYLHDKCIEQATRHWHIRSEWLGRKIYEWPESQRNPTTSMAKESAVVKRYKLDPTTYNLYESASVHTVVKHKIPKMAYLAAGLVVALPIGTYAALQRFNDRYVEPKTEVSNIAQVQNKEVANAINVPPPTQPPQNLQQETQQLQPVRQYENVQIVSNQYDWSEIAACMAFADKCTCYGHSAQRLIIPDAVCRSATDAGWIGKQGGQVVTRAPEPIPGDGVEPHADQQPMTIDNTPSRASPSNA